MRFETVLEHRLVRVLGELTLLGVLETDRDELERRLVDAGGDGDDGTMRECLHLILDEAAEDPCYRVFDVSARAREARSGC